MLTSTRRDGSKYEMPEATHVTLQDLGHMRSRAHAGNFAKALESVDVHEVAENQLVLSNNGVVIAKFRSQ